MVNNKINRVFLFRNDRSDSCPLWKFDVLKTSILVFEASLLGLIIQCFKNIKFSRGNYQTDSSSTETL